MLKDDAVLKIDQLFENDFIEKKKNTFMFTHKMAVLLSRLYL